MSIEGNAPGDVMIDIEENYLKTSMTVRIGCYDWAAKTGYHLTAGTWRKVDPAETDDFDLLPLRMLKADAQNLFDKLWRLGYRPKPELGEPTWKLDRRILAELTPAMAQRVRAIVFFDEQQGGA